MRAWLVAGAVWAAIAGMSGPMWAAEVVPVSYAMLNGESGYRDELYTGGSGDSASNLAPLSGGLGQLVDGVVGADSYNANLGNGVAHEWVGWSSVAPDIVFDLGTVTSLTSVAIHANNQRVGGVGLFGQVTLTFSTDGVTFGAPRQFRPTGADRLDVSARYHVVPVVRSARYVRMRFEDGPENWIFLSEVKFNAPIAAAPVASPVGGAFATGPAVSWSATTPGATIRYTTNGLEPNEQSPVFGAPVTLAASAVLKARTFAPGHVPSVTRRDDYRVGGAATIAPLRYAMVNGQTGSYNYWDNSYGGPGATGNPSANLSPLAGGLGQLTDGVIGGNGIGEDLGSGPAHEWVGWSSVNPVITFELGAAAQALSGVSIHANNQGDVGLFGSVTVTFSDDGTNFGNAVSYTTSRVERDERRAQFVFVPFTRTARFVRLSFTDGDLPWQMLSEIVFNRAPVAFPEITPAGGAFNGPQTVSMSCATPGASIHYTTDGSEPSTGSTLYTGPFAWGAVATIKAKAFKSGDAPSGTTARTFTFSDGLAGKILRERFNGASYYIDSLRFLATYPDAADVRDYRASFEVPVNVADYYGTRMRGYVLPAESGYYRFWVSGDNQCHLYLSPNNDPNAKSLIAYLSDYSAVNAWYWYPIQQSAPVFLEAGRRYYIEAIQAESTGADHLSVAWELPNGTFEGPIPGPRLAPYGESDVPDELAAPAIAPGGGDYFAGSPVQVRIVSRDPAATIRFTTDGTDPGPSSPIYSGPIAVTTETQVNARAFRTGWTSSGLTSARFKFAPAPVLPTGQQLWLRAEAGVTLGENGQVVGWADQSGNGYDAEQLLSEYQRPHWLTNGINGRASIRFDGADDGMTVDSQLVVGRPSTVFVVFKKLPGTSGRILQGGSSGADWLLGTYLSDDQGLYANGWVTRMDGTLNAATVVAGIMRSGSSAFVVNGQDLTADPAPVGVPGGGLHLGGGVGRAFQPVHADLGEVMVYNRLLSHGERETVEKYLADKYRAYDVRATEPELGPASGTYSNAVAVTMSSPTPGAQIRFTLDGTVPSESSTLFTAPVPVNASATVKARTFAPGYAASYVTERRYEIGSALPVPPAGLRLWLAAGSGVTRDTNNAVLAWADLSGNGFAARQNEVIRQPVWVTNALGGQPALRFDGANDYMLVDTALQVQRPSSVFVIYQRKGNAGRVLSSASSPDWFLGMHANSGGIHGFYVNGTWVRVGPAALVNEPKIAVGLQTATTAEFYLNGENLTATSAAAGNLNRICLGSLWAGQGEFAGADIAEVLVYDRTVSSGEREGIEAYLAGKYNLYTPRVALPAVSPVNGRSATNLVVTMSCSTSDSTIRYTLDGSEPTEASAAYSGPMLLTTSTTVKARAYRAGFLPSYVSERRYEIGAVSDPISLSGLQLWLRADLSVTRGEGNLVSRWGDFSGNGFDAVQNESIRQPLYVTNGVGGLPVIRFDGVNDGLMGDAACLVGRPSTVFVVFQRVGTLGRLIQSGNGHNYLLGLHATPGYFASGWVRQTVAPIGVPFLACALQNLSNSRYFVNGEDFTDDSGPTGQLGRVALGGGVGTYNEPANGDISELIVYNRVLTDSERQTVERYLAEKYNVFPPRVALPVIAPASGTYTNGVTVSMSATTSGSIIRYTRDASEPNQDSTQFTAPFDLTTNATIRARAFVAGLAPSEVASQHYRITGASVPEEAGALRLWLAADGPVALSGSNAVARWVDQSGNGFDAPQTDSTRRPLWVAEGLNGRPAIRFGATDQGLLVDANLQVGRPSTVFLVYHKVGSTAGERVLQSASTSWLLGPYSSSIHGYYAGGWVSPTTLVPTIGTGYVAVAVQATRGSDFYLDGAQITANRNPEGTIGQLVINGLGAYAGMNNVEVSEILVYGEALAEERRRLVERYLGEKYGIELAVATPVIEPPGGACNGQSLPITLRSATPEAEIRYTTNGLDPTADSMVFSGPFTVNSTVTVKARAFTTNQSPSSVASATFYVTPGTGEGLALRQVFALASVGYTDTRGLDRVTEHWSYPWEPYQTTFETQMYRGGFGDHYGTRFRAYFYPPESGDYRFDMIHDDAARFWISSDDNPDNRAMIYQAACCVGSYASGRSGPVTLEAGRRYYIEALQAENNGGDYVGVGVLFPSGRHVAPMPGLLDWDLNATNGAEWTLLSLYGDSDEPSQLTRPQILPRGGLFAGPVSVTLQSQLSGVTMYYTLDGSEPSATHGTLYGGPFTVSASATVRARAVKAGSIDSEVAVAPFTIDPTTTFTRDRLAFWFRADGGTERDGSDRVVSWWDQSGNGWHARQTAEGNRPLWVASGPGGMAALRFNGSSSFLAVPYRVQAGARTLSYVVEFAGLTGPGGYQLLGVQQANANSYVGIRNGGTVHAVMGDGGGDASFALAATNRYLVTAVADGKGTFTVYVNGRAVQSHVMANDVSATIDFLIGRLGGSYYMNADLPEVALFQKALSDSERDAWESYAAERYGIARQVSTPVMLPWGGILVGPTNVMLTTATAGAEIRFTLDGSEPTASSPLMGGAGIPVDQEATVRVRAFRAGMIPSTEVSGTFWLDDATQFERAGLLAWFRGDRGTSGGPVGEWRDQSGQGSHAVQGTAGAQPLWTTNAINGRPALRFDGTSDFLNLPPGFGDFRQGLTLAVVASPGAMGAWQRMIELGRGGNQDAIWLGRFQSSSTLTFETYLSGSSGGQLNIADGMLQGIPQIFAVVLDSAGTATMFKNGVAQGSGAVAVPRDVLRYVNAIGRGSSGGTTHFAGDIAEVMVFDRALDGIERDALFEYLRGRYGVESLTVAPPQFSPLPGFYANSVLVQIGTATPDAVIRFTTNGMDPDLSSPIYNAAFLLNTSRTVKARGYKTGFNDSPVSSAFYAVGDGPSTGDGLAAEFYDNADFTGTSHFRRDGTVNFQWGSGAPVWFLNGDHFGSRWTGEVQAQFSEATTFHVTSDDGARLWVDDALIIDGWNGPAGERSATVMLTRGARHGLRLEHREVTGGASCRLEWSSLSQPRQVIPQSQLFANLPFANTVVTPTPSPAAGVFGGSANVTLWTPSSGATIRYTVDGSVPTTNAPIFDGTPLSIVAPTTVRARAFYPGFNPSGFYEGTFEIDVAGPVVSNLRFNGAALTDGTVLTGSGTFRADASDVSGVSRVQFDVERASDGVSLFQWTDANASDGYSAAWQAELVPDGAYRVVVRAYDTFNAQSVQSVPVTVQLAPPSAPSITAPANGTETNERVITVRGTAPVRTEVWLELNGTLGPVAVPVATDGSWTSPVVLVEGANQLRARARNRAGDSPFSTAVTVTLDAAIPRAPVGLVAFGLDGGRIRVRWNAPLNTSVASYDVWRSDAPFEATGAAVKVGDAVRGQQIDDVPATEGMWYYRVATRNTAGTLSDLSEIVSAESDATAPVAARVVFEHRDPNRVRGGRLGPGLVDVMLEVSEPVDGLPFLSLLPQGGLPLGISLQAAGSTNFQGTFALPSDAGTGEAQVQFSARDAVGNRGSAVEEGAVLVIDARGPYATNFALIDALPPLQNIPPTNVAFSLVLDEAPEGTPEVRWRLTRLAGFESGQPAVLAPGPSPREWTGTVPLPAGAGAPPEELVFELHATDDLGNGNSRILGQSRFEVYQGGLPGLNPPVTFVGRSLPQGRVWLEWSGVTQASGYQVLRSALGGGPLLPLTNLPASATSFVDIPGSDGMYLYSIATRRSANGQESVGAEFTPALSLRADSVAPGAPRELSLSLTGGGVRATWDRPEPVPSEPVSYSLYRGAANPIVSTNGLTRVVTGVAGLTALDALPSATDHSYVLTAVDEAGNESPLSNSAYLNATLWPVRGLTVFQEGNAAPQLSWVPPVTGDFVGTHVYLADGTNRLLVLDAPLGVTNHTDSGFNGGNRFFAVTTVDAAEMESPERRLLLPALSLDVPPDLEIRRGLMNRLSFIVENRSGTNVSSARIHVRLGDRDHVSQPFTMPTNGWYDPSVVVGGYETLTGSNVTFTARLEWSPAANDRVVIARTGTATVVPGGMLAQVLPGDFTRGGSGQVQLKLNNPSDEMVEIVAARQFGGAPSDEVRFVLENEQGNVLARAPFQQATGSNVVTLSDGTTVLRVPARSEIVTGATLLACPSNTPDLAHARVTVDAVHHRLAQPEAVHLGGFTTRSAVSLREASYVARLTNATPRQSFGQGPIVLEGVTEDRVTGLPLPRVPVRIGVVVDGFERSAIVESDAAGGIRFEFEPLSGESGQYGAFAVHPDLSDRTVQQTFTIGRVVVTPRVATLRAARNFPVTLAVKVAASPGVTASNLVLELAGTPPAGLTVTLPDPVNLGPGQATTLPVEIVGDANAADIAALVLRLRGPGEPPSGWGTVSVQLELTEAAPVLSYAPTFLQTGVNPGAAITETVTLKNVGLAAVEGVEVTLSVKQGGQSLAAPAWATLTTENAIGTLEIGAELPVGLNFQPPTGTAYDDYDFALRVEAANHPSFEVPIQLSVTSSEKGNVLFKLADIYTGLPDPDYVGAPHADPAHPLPTFQGVRGATVTLQSETNPSLVWTRTSDGYGEADFRDFDLDPPFFDVPAGRYKFRVISDKHDSVVGRVTVRPGVTANQNVALRNRLVTVTWEVVPTTIEDVYEIVLDATFETDVPAAVVVAEPAAFNVPQMCAGDVYYGEFRLSNYGLIRADKVRLQVPGADQYFRYEVLSGIPDTLEAQESIVIPYRITCLEPFPGNCPADETSLVQNGGAANGPFSASVTRGVSDSGGAELTDPLRAAAVNARATTRAGGAGCVRYTRCIPVEYEFKCANQLIFSGSATHCANYLRGSCGGQGGPAGSSTGGGPATGGPGYGGSGGPGGGGSMDGLWCKPGCLLPPPFCCKKSEDAGSSVSKVDGEFSDDVIDITGAVPGMQFEIGRIYEGNVWQFNTPTQWLRFEWNKDQTALAAIRYLNSEFKPQGSNYVFRGMVIRPEGSGWRLDDPGSAIWRTFNEAGQPTGMGVAEHVQATLHYNGAGLLQTIQNSNSVAALTFGYDGVGRLNAITNDTGAYVVYGYTGEGRLETVRDIGGQITRYSYDAAGRITRKDLPDGKWRQIQYHPNFGYVTSVLDQNNRGRFFEFGFDAANREYYSKVTETSGRVVEYFFDNDRVEKRIEVNGVVVMEALLTEQETLVRDGRGNETITSALDAGRVIVTTNPDGSQTRQEFDRTTNALLKRIDERGAATRYEYDGDKRLTKVFYAAGTPQERVEEFSYNARGQLWKRRIVGGAARTADGTPILDENGAPVMLPDAVTEMEHDAFGRQTATIDPEGNRTEVEYDAHNNVVLRRDGLNRETAITYDPLFFNKIKRKVNALGHDEEYFYDALGRLERYENALGHAMTYSYETNRVIVTGPDGARAITEFDLDGRKSRLIDPEGHEFRYEYDIHGRNTRIVDPTGDAFETVYHPATFSYTGGGYDLVQEVRTPGYTRRFEYGAGQQIARETITGPNSPAVSVEFDLSDVTGATATAVNGLGERATAFRDWLGNQTRIETEVNGQTYFREFEYDSRGNRRTVRDANGAETHLHYDRNDNLVRKAMPAGNWVTYEYDENNRPFRSVNALGRKVEIEWDAAGRPVTHRFFATAGDVTPGKEVQFGFNELGLMRGWTNGAVSGYYEYDALGRKTLEQVNYGSFVRSHRWTYFGNDKVKTFTGPDGVTFSYTYEGGQKLKTVSAPDLGTVTFNAYHWFAPKTVTYPGGSTRDIEYNAQMKQTRNTFKGPGGGALFDEVNVYDAAGQLTRKTTLSGLQTFEYDELGQLERMNTTDPEMVGASYTYDLAFNRTSGPGVSSNEVELAVGNLLMRYGSNAFAYNINGDVTNWTASGAEVALEYDLQQNVTEVRVNGSVAARYGYDPFGRRLWKDVGGERTYYYWVDEALAAEMDGAGNVVRSYGYRPGGMGGLDPLFMRTVSGYLFFACDALGTPQKLFTSSGVVVWSVKYDAFGQATVAPGLPVQCNLRGSNQYFDEETGLHYNLQRYYAPGFGRYLQSDPLGLRGDLNAYAFANNAPQQWVDIAGEKSGWKDSEALCIDVRWDSALELKGPAPPLPQLFINKAEWKTTVKITAQGRFCLGICCDKKTGNISLDYGGKGCISAEGSFGYSGASGEGELLGVKGKCGLMVEVSGYIGASFCLEKSVCKEAGCFAVELKAGLKASVGGGVDGEVQQGAPGVLGKYKGFKVKAGIFGELNGSLKKKCKICVPSGVECDPLQACIAGEVYAQFRIKYGVNDEKDAAGNKTGKSTFNDVDVRYSFFKGEYCWEL